MTEINNRIEEVKKILEDLYWRGKRGTDTPLVFIDIQAKVICQLFPQPLDDKELREKIASEILYKMVTVDHARMDIAPLCYEYADPILALLQPKIEEARRQEGERIFRQLQVLGGATSDKGMFIRFQMNVADWQALKGGE